MEINFIQSLFEAGDGPRIPHPEDSIFQGAAAAAQMLESLKEIVADPSRGSIKWDGGIALIFGYTPAGEFYINDKYMPVGYYAKSPADWEHYDTTVKRSKTARTDLYPKLGLIWNGLKSAVTEQGTFKGDLMWTGNLNPQNGYFVFKPTTVEYKVPVNSPIGKVIAGKVAGIVVHQHNGAPWDGKSGLANNSNVAVLAPTAGITFTLKNPVQFVADADKAITTQGKLADDFMAGLPGVVKSALQTYMNKRVTKQTDQALPEWIQANVSAKQVQFLLGSNNDGYLEQNNAGLMAIFNIWNALYRLKDNLAQQLEPQVRGFEQWVNGQRAGEGFVFPTRQGLIKIVNRAGFGVAHFNK